VLTGERKRAVSDQGGQGISWEKPKPPAPSPDYYGQQTPPAPSQPLPHPPAAPYSAPQYGAAPQQYGAAPQHYSVQPAQYGAQPPPYGAPDPYAPQPQWGQQPQWGGYGYPPVGRTTNGMAIASMVLGILWLFYIGSVLALIFGYIAKSQIRARNENGGGMATAGIVLGWIGVGIFVLIVVIGVANNT
jgi:Domain of unknown function (DUF4190)